MTGTLIAFLAGLTAQAFFAGLWQGCLLIAVVGIAFRLLPRVGPALRFAGWGFAFVLASVLPFIHAAGRQATTSAIHLNPLWGFAIAALWIALMLRRVAQLLFEAIRLRGIWQRATPVTADPETQALLNATPRRAQLCLSPDVDSPSVIGFLVPRLLVPETLHPQLSPTELRQIVLHECEHLRRRDDWINLAQKLALALFPLNPALLWVDRRLSLERELACDAGVVAANASPFDYAHCLTRLAEHRLAGRPVALALSAWNRQSELARRVHTLLRPMASLSPLQARAALALLTLGLIGGGMEMARVPQLVAFTQAASPEQFAELQSSPAGQAVPVVFHEPDQPRPTFLQATAPRPRTIRKTARVVSPASQPRMLLTLANEPTPEFQTETPMRRIETIQMERIGTQQVRVRRIVAVSTEFSPSYAAVPFGDGWLIVKL